MPFPHNFDEISFKPHYSPSNAQSRSITILKSLQIQQPPPDLQTKPSTGQLTVAVKAHTFSITQTQSGDIQSVIYFCFQQSIIMYEYRVFSRDRNKVTMWFQVGKQEIYIQQMRQYKGILNQVPVIDTIRLWMCKNSDITPEELRPNQLIRIFPRAKSFRNIEPQSPLFQKNAIEHWGFLQTLPGDSIKYLKSSFWLKILSQTTALQNIRYFPNAEVCQSSQLFKFRILNLKKLRLTLYYKEIDKAILNEINKYKTIEHLRIQTQYEETPIKLSQIKHLDQSLTHLCLIGNINIEGYQSDKLQSLILRENCFYNLMFLQNFRNLRRLQIDTMTSYRQYEQSYLMDYSQVPNYCPLLRQISLGAEIQSKKQLKELLKNLGGQLQSCHILSSFFQQGQQQLQDYFAYRFPNCRFNFEYIS